MGIFPVQVYKKLTHNLHVMYIYLYIIYYFLFIIKKSKTSQTKGVKSIKSLKNFCPTLCLTLGELSDLKSDSQILGVSRGSLVILCLLNSGE